MKNPVSDKDWSMYPDRPEILEDVKNATSYGLGGYVESNWEYFGQRVRVGKWFKSPSKSPTWMPRSPEFELSDRTRGYRYEIEIAGGPDDWNVEYVLSPFRRGFIGFRVVRNK